jgi:hypothetical protein
MIKIIGNYKNEKEYELPFNVIDRLNGNLDYLGNIIIY